MRYETGRVYPKMQTLFETKTIMKQMVSKKEFLIRGKHKKKKLSEVGRNLKNTGTMKYLAFFKAGSCSFTI
jgi:hypothetical protein